MKKNFKLVLALILALTLVMGMAVAANAASIKINATSDASGSQKDTTTYTWYRMFEADITEAPSGSPVQSGGQVAYYVTTQDRATAIENTGLFNVVRVGTTNKWYVELKTQGTSAAAIGEAFAAIANLDTVFEKGTFAQTTVASSVTADNLAAGYYFIKSTAGKNIVLQTLADTEITEKNEFPTDDKTIPQVDEHSQIGQEITYTLTVNVPETANDEIVLKDTMSKGLTFVEIVNDPLSGTPSAVQSGTSGSTFFTITYSKDQIIAYTSGASDTQTFNVTVKVKVNDEAAIDTGIPNTVDLKYGNNYEAVPKTVYTETTHFDFDKVDGANSSTKLTGAEFQLTADGSGSAPIKLIKVEEGKTYRIATPEEITQSGSSLTDTIVTNGNTITVNGLDGDLTYKLVETKAPTGYNQLDEPITVAPSGSLFVKKNVENNKGTVLPSTGGIGTTIFYIGGSILVLAAAILLITKRRMSNND